MNTRPRGTHHPFIATGVAEVYDKAARVTVRTALESAMFGMALDGGTAETVDGIVTVAHVALGSLDEPINAENLDVVAIEHPGEGRHYAITVSGTRRAVITLAAAGLLREQLDRILSEFPREGSTHG